MRLFPDVSRANFLSSGAGKTTFLAALAKRCKLTSGTVKINGHVASKETMMGTSSYMPQFDVLPSALTPREYILFMVLKRYMQVIFF